MGRDNGYVAMWATLANRNVNVCLIPESNFDLYGPKGLLTYIENRCRHRGHAIIVLAEGAAAGCRDRTFAAGTNFGEVLTEEIRSHFLRKNIDP